MRAAGVFLVLAVAGCGAESARQHATATVRAKAQPPQPAAVPRGDGAPMVRVPAGEFLMGSAAGEGEADERPQHRLTLRVFEIDRVEVTVERYGKCVAAGRCTRPKMGGDCNHGVAGRGEHPVNCVDWEQARAYCAWAGKRLPTEAEWEKAARGTDGRQYPWGDEAATCKRAVMDDGDLGCGKQSTWAVGSKPAGASPYGAMDMAGNVWEWVADWYDAGYYATSPNANPSGPASGSARVVRGGGWFFNATYLRAAFRHRFSPTIQEASFGFRCAETVSP